MEVSPLASCCDPWHLCQMERGARGAAATQSSEPGPRVGPVLAAEGVRKRYDDVLALNDATLSVGAGECVAVVGESGSGKTTLLRCFNRLVVPDGGQVFAFGDDVSSVDPIELRRRIGYVPQDGGLLPHWRVGRNVEMVLRLRRDD